MPTMSCSMIAIKVAVAIHRFANFIYIICILLINSIKFVKGRPRPQRANDENPMINFEINLYLPFC